MLDLGFLRIGIKADTDEAKAKLKGMQDEMGKTESKSKASAAQIEAAQKSLNGAFGTLAKGAAVAGAAIGGAFLATGKAALDSYAQYEQLKGGVETLFKGSSETLMKYAQNAYKTAGISANQYMETVTGFSASLINSLGGDTAAAAEYANMAINDMADNAATFGTSMEDLQETYQSLAKGNLQMLDNLKLGFDGNKAGLQAMIDKANEMKVANGEAADLTVDSYASILEAIHLVQQDTDIMGCAQEEAAKTIEGSVNMMKAAWENWLTGLGDSEADMTQLTTNLVDSFITVMGNVVPKVKEIFSKVVEQIPVVFDELKAQLPAQIQEVIGIIETMLPALGIIAASIGGLFAGNAMTQIPAFIGKISGAVQGLFGLIAANPIIGVVAAIGGIIAALVALYNTNEEFRAKVDEVFNALAPVIQTLIDNFMNLATQVGTVVMPIIQMVVDTFTQFAMFIIPIVGEALGFILGIFNAVFPSIQQVVMSVFGIIQSVIQTAMGVIQGIIQVVTGIISGDWSMVWNGIQQIATSVWNGIKGFITNAINAVKGIIDTVLGIIRNLWDSAWNGIKDFLGGCWDGIKQAVSDGINNVVDFFRNLPQNILNALGNLGTLLWDAGTSIIQGLWDGLTSKFKEVQDWVMGIGDWIAEHKGPKPYDLKLLIPNGGWIMKSLATGLQKALPEVQKALDSVAGEIQGYDFGAATVEADFNSFKSAKAALSNSKPNAAQATSIVVNNYSPKALNEKESARQFRISARQLAFS